MSIFSSLRRDLKGGTKAYKDLVKQRNKWVEQELRRQGFDPALLNAQPSGGGSADAADFASQWIPPEGWAEAQQKAKELSTNWITTLPPEQQKKAASEFALHSSDMDSINRPK